jgi:hypothetical protein
MGDGLGLYNPENQQTYVLNATSAVVWQHCDGATTPLQLIEVVRQKFNVPRHQAEQLTWMALDELSQANLLDAVIVRPLAATPLHPLSVPLSRRQMLAGAAAAGLALALVPLVAPVAVRAGGGHILIPLLDCVEDNGDGTFTAHFGYLNNSDDDIFLPIGAKNMLIPDPHIEDVIGVQPSLFEPGQHNNVFAVIFDSSESIKWMLKADGDRRHQVEASADSELCTTTTTTTTLAPTTTTPSCHTPTARPDCPFLR